MKRSILPFLLVIFLFSLLPESACCQVQMVNTYVNGMNINVYPTIREGIAYLPVQALATALGVNIQWDPRLNTIKIDNTVVAAPPLMLEGRLYLPMESIAQSIGASVEWDGKNRCIRISTRGGPAPLAGFPSQPEDAAFTATGRSSPIIKGKTIPIPLAPSTVSTPAAVYPVAPSSPGAGTPSTSFPTTTVHTYGTQGTTQAQYPGGTPYTTYPSPSAYPPASSSDKQLPSIYPLNAPPKMPPGLELPTPGTPYYPSQESSSTPSSIPTEVYSTPTFHSAEIFVPKTASNSVFSITVTNIEYVGSIKNYYKPKPGSKYIIVYLSQQNISDSVQIYTGRFSLLDDNNKSYDYIEGLSNFWLVILRPGGINFGYLVFDLPENARPTQLVLHALNQPPLALSLL